MYNVKGVQINTFDDRSRQANHIILCNKSYLQWY